MSLKENDNVETIKKECELYKAKYRFMLRRSERYERLIFDLNSQITNLTHKLNENEYKKARANSVLDLIKFGYSYSELEKISDDIKKDLEGL